MEWQSMKKEKAAQELFYKGEKLYLNLLKEKGKEDSSENKSSSKHEKVIEVLKQVVTQYPSTSTAWVAALLLGDILRQENRSKEALELTQHLPWPKKTAHLLSALALNQRGSLLADEGDCKGAIHLWKQVVPGLLSGKGKKIPFFYQEVRLRMAICHERLKNWQIAKNIYESLIYEKKGAPSLQTMAKKYLQLLNFKIKEGKIHL